jgi:hypothetical protein
MPALRIEALSFFCLEKDLAKSLTFFLFFKKEGNALKILR